jgi:hypothetical protein
MIDTSFLACSDNYDDDIDEKNKDKASTYDPWLLSYCRSDAALNPEFPPINGLPDVVCKNP